MSVDVGGEKRQSEEETTLITCVFSICYTLYTIATALRLKSKRFVMANYWILISFFHISNKNAGKEPVTFLNLSYYPMVITTGHLGASKCVIAGLQRTKCHEAGEEKKKEEEELLTGTKQGCGGWGKHGRVLYRRVTAYSPCCKYLLSSILQLSLLWFKIPRSNRICKYQFSAIPALNWILRNFHLLSVNLTYSFDKIMCGTNFTKFTSDEHRLSAKFHTVRLMSESLF